MDNRPIGIFDSGLGGLTAVSALRALLPEENIIYFGDTGRCPYGTRPRDQLRKMALQNMDFLASFGCKMIFAACGTVSVNCTDLMDAYSLPVFNLLSPSVEAMTAIPGNGALAVLATEASIRTGGFQNKILERCGAERKVIGIPCQDFVSLCESGNISKDDPLLSEAVRRYLGPAKKSGLDGVLLGCTHFGIISDAIEDYLGKNVQLVSAAECGIGTMTEYILSNHLQGTGGTSLFYTSGSTEEFDRMASVILGETYRERSHHISPAEC